MIKPCKRCDKLKHKIKCLLLELGLHRDKHNYLGKKEKYLGKSTVSSTNSIKCTNCGKPIKRIGVMMPTANPKHRNMCTSCGDKVLKLDRKIRI